MPGIALRSSFIVGFPGEREEDVAELCRFLEEFELDHVGVFRYSREEGTPAAELADQVAERLKTERRARVMEVQAGVAARRAAAWVGRRIEVLVEGVDESGRLSGRTASQAPEIDGIVRLRGQATPGDIVQARLTGAATYDLEGEILSAAVDTSASGL